MTLVIKIYQCLCMCSGESFQKPQCVPRLKLLLPTPALTATGKTKLLASEKFG